MPYPGDEFQIPPPAGPNFQRRKTVSMFKGKRSDLNGYLLQRKKNARVMIVPTVVTK